MRRRIIDGRSVVRLVEKYCHRVKRVVICAPFITTRGMSQILKALGQKRRVHLELITKFDPVDLLLGYSDREVFEDLFERNRRFAKWSVKIWIVDQLHAKAIVLGSKIGVLGSSNITSGGFQTNEELGAVLQGPMLRQLQQQLEAFQTSENRLTEEEFLWKKTQELPRYQPYVSTIKRLMGQLQREKESGLTSFTRSGRQAQGTYFHGILDFLSWLKKREPCPEREALAWLHRHALLGGKEINEARLAFLARVGVLARTSRGLRVKKPTGDALINQQSPEVLYDRMRSAYREFRDIEDARFSRPVHPRDLAKELPGERKQKYWAIRLRWLEALGRAKRVTVDRKDYFRLRLAPAP